MAVAVPHKQGWPVPLFSCQKELQYCLWCVQTYAMPMTSPEMGSLLMTTQP